MNEQEFLACYDPRAYDPFALTADILLFSVATDKSENYRKLDEKKFSVLLVKRDTHPFLGKWCLPGGFVHANEEIDCAAARILTKETNLQAIYMEQLFTFGTVKRDPRMRVVSCAYMALVDKNMLAEPLAENAEWFHIHTDSQQEQFTVTLRSDNEELCYTVKRNDTLDCKLEIVQNEGLAFDNPLAITTGMERLKNKITYTDIVFHMMPKRFTLKELQQVYEIILGKKLLDAAFRRMVADKVIETAEMKTGEGHRPSRLYRYKEDSACE